MIDAVLRRSARNTSLFLLIYNLGFAQAFVDYERGARAGGSSSWTLRKRAKLAIDMLTGFSAAPIRVASLAGVARRPGRHGAGKRHADPRRPG